MTTNKTLMMGLALSLGAALTACGEATDATAPGDVEATGALGLGASGPSVATAQRYLRAFGYLPNEALARQFPSWRPIVTDEPARADLLDATMSRALAKAQVNLGLPATGTLDHATLEVMAQPRCGVPDVDHGAQRVDKFALYPAANRWTKTNITFRFGTAGGIGQWQQVQARAIISAGIKAWEAFTNLTFTEVTSGGDFVITFRNIDGVSNILGAAGSPPSPAMEFDTSETWAGNSLLAVTIHESGHLIGIDHSSYGNSVLGFPIMHPVNHNITQHTDDDIIGANAIYNTWTQMPGAAIDIGANSIIGSTGEVVWVLGTNGAPFRWNGSGWESVSGVTGSRLDVDPQGHAVVVLTDGRIFRHQGFVGQPAWVELPGGGRAKDVGVGQNGAIYVIGTDNRAYVFNSGLNGWQFSGGPSNMVSIDVTPTGQPQAVTSNNQLWVLGANNTWVQVGSGFGADIGIGGKNNGPGTRQWMFVLGTNSQVFLNDSQPGLVIPFPCDTGTCTSGAPATDSYVGTNGFGTRVSVGARGKAYVTTSSNAIFFRTEMP